MRVAAPGPRRVRDVNGSSTRWPAALDPTDPTMPQRARGAPLDGVIVRGRRGGRPLAASRAEGIGKTPAPRARRRLDGLSRGPLPTRTAQCPNARVRARGRAEEGESFPGRGEGGGPPGPRPSPRPPLLCRGRGRRRAKHSVHRLLRAFVLPVTVLCVTGYRALRYRLPCSALPVTVLLCRGRGRLRKNPC